MRQCLLLFLLVAPAIIQLTQSGLCVSAEEDEVEDDGVVEDEEADGGAASAADGEGADETLGGEKKNVSPDADTTLLFTRPSTAPGAVELPAGHIVEFLVGFANKGKSDFVIETLDASFRYPMDFTFHIQNFSAIAYQKTVKPSEEATIAYSFIPADAFAGRPIGLTINLAYRDSEGNFFFDPVFNETVQIVEFDEGFDTEVFFMYVLLGGFIVLVLFLVYNFAGGKPKGKKGSSSGSKPVETGTANDDVDYEWIPRSALRTPGSSKTSPRQRKGNRSAGSDTE